MRSTCLLQLASILSSLVLTEGQDVSGPALSCVTSSPAHGRTRVLFLREDRTGARSLYFTLWSEDTRLLSCTVIADPQITERYRNLCSENQTWGQGINPRFSVDAVLDPAGPCAQLSLSEPKFARRRSEDGTEGKTRRKRAWILPGTLWCGSGSRAGGYDQLGMFESADRCCREHDHCLHIIPAFTVNYGVFNSHLYTVSHCECDQRFRECLQGVNDSISSMVGYSFFNILQVPCFELKPQRRCTEMYWWGMRRCRYNYRGRQNGRGTSQACTNMPDTLPNLTKFQRPHLHRNHNLSVRCKRAKVAPYAIFKNPLPFNTTDNTSKDVDTENYKLASKELQFVTESPKIILDKKSPKTEQRCSFRDLPRGDTFHRRKTKGRGCKLRQKPSEAASSASTTPPMLQTDLFNASESSAATSNARQAGRNKAIRKALSAYPTQRSNTSKNSARKSSTALPSISPITQSQKTSLQPLTTVMSVKKRTNKHKKFKKLNQCCGSKKPGMGDAFQARCKNCHEQDTASSKTSATQEKTTRRHFPKETTQEKLPVKKKAETSKRHSLATLSDAVTSAAAVTTEFHEELTRHVKNEQKQQVESNPMRSSSKETLIHSNVTYSAHAARSLQEEDHNKADHQVQCESLKLLDECNFKIPPLEQKYNVQNWESKIIYHCDCTKRLATKMGSLKLTSIVASLLVDFVSQQCLTLPKKKKCLHRKSCTGGFTEASDLHQALKKMEKKDTAGVQHSSGARKRGIPVRLYKRCLRLKREADFMAVSR